ncbi:MAG: lipo-like protein [Rhodanobacter sp.]|nr:MAG: lipo-like protein [Rhodanobacter sp.]TAL98618.1 MAG: lipo-like protein [Rhodanobacter sp.]TAM41579.1 MAG: lipo-like protein [Rhodanobacter sp.]TAN28314.1 MAG: lipo-like protein [Rhodanobacter sp.]
MFHPLRWFGRALARYLSQPRAGARHFGTSGFALLEASLRPGDVLLVDGSSRISSAIKYITQSSWSHAALFVGNALRDQYPKLGAHVLIEADVLDGVRAVPLEVYRGAHTRICRPVGLDAGDIARVIEHASRRLGQRYDMRNVIDLMRYLVPAPPVPGRWRRRLLALGSGEPTQAICSSLIAAAFQSVCYPILPILDPGYRKLRGTQAARREILHIRSSKLFTPRDFDISPYFRIIKPLLEHDFDPHHLHWATSAQVGPRPPATPARLQPPL